MEVKTEVKCKPNGHETDTIRRLFCTESHNDNADTRNPLIQTEFNQLLADIVQLAFDEGRRYETKQNIK